jgi:nucleoside-diphosphate-sugar epimerase
MKILVTGGSGFIGNHLVERLLQKGFEVVAPVRPGRIQALPSHGRLEVIETDLLNPDRIRYLVKNVDVVYHLASIRGSGWSFDDVSVRQVNVDMTRNLLAASRAENVKHFIYISSVSVFGHPSGGPIHENSPFVPITRYGRSKLESEQLLRKNAGRLCATIVRPVITYGPGDTWGMPTKLIRLINSGKYLTVGNGKNRIHLIYIEDLIDGLMLVMEKRTTGVRDYILAGSEPVEINRLVQIIAAVLQRKIPRIHVPIFFALSCGFLMEETYKLFHAKQEPFLTCDKVDIMNRDRFFDSGRAGRELGFAPEVNYENGIRKTADWLRDSKQI